MYTLFFWQVNTLFLRPRPSILLMVATVTTIYVGLICNSIICIIRINSAYNTGMKTVIVIGCALHYYNFPTCITCAINSKCYSQPYYYIIQISLNFIFQKFIISTSVFRLDSTEFRYVKFN